MISIGKVGCFFPQFIYLGMALTSKVKQAWNAHTEAPADSELFHLPSFFLSRITKTPQCFQAVVGLDWNRYFSKPVLNIL